MEFEGEPVAHSADPDEEVLEGVQLNMETPLKKLKDLCDQLGLSRSGGQGKVLARLRQQREILGRRMTAEVARKMYLEENREPDMPRIPILPSARQQELHSITHQPFQSWCEHCVLSRSKQSPHAQGQQEVEQKVDEKVRVDPVIQIDYAFTCTKSKYDTPAEAGQPGNDDQAGQAGNGEQAKDQGPEEEEKGDKRDQYGLTLVAAESTTGWVLAIPVQEKGAGSLKCVTEQLVRLSLQVSPGDAVTIQGDPEPSIKQILNAVEACRARLGLKNHDPADREGVPPKQRPGRESHRQCAPQQPHPEVVPRGPNFSQGRGG